MNEPAASPSNPDAAETWVSEIVTNDQQGLERERAAQTPQKRRSWLPVLIPLALVCLGLTAWNPGRMSLPASTSTSDPDAVAALSLQISIAMVEDYRDTMGRFPTHLADAHPHASGVEYNLAQNGTYTLSAGAPGHRVHYRSNQPVPNISHVLGPIVMETLR